MEVPEAEPPRSSTVGTRIEALNEGGLWRRDVPFLPEEESGKRVVPSPENLSILSSKRRVLVHSGSDKTYF